MTLKELMAHVNDNIQNDRPAGHGLLIDGYSSGVLNPFSMALNQPERYSLKPRTVVINGHEVKIGVNKVYKGLDYFIASPIHSTYEYHFTCSGDQCVDLSKKLVDRGLVFDNREDAIAMAKAMLDFKEV